MPGGLRCPTQGLAGLGANPNIANDEGVTPQLAARKGCNVECEV